MPRTNAARAAAALVHDLTAAGVRDVVVCPGSRSAPLAYAFHAAERSGALTLHIRADERSAGFFALGLARATGTPAVIVTTSGTAVANLTPAAWEAHHSHIPWIALTADRPPAQRETWVNQTTACQHAAFDDCTRATFDIDDEQHTSALGVGRRAVEAACGSHPDLGPGPVHINAAFAPPLDERISQLPLQPSEAPPLPSLPRGGTLSLPPRVVVVAGADAGSAAAAFARSAGLPLLAEPASGAHDVTSVCAYRLLLRHFSARVEAVVVFGRPTLSREISALLASSHMHVVAPPWHAPPDTPATRHTHIPTVTSHPDTDWLTTWHHASHIAQNIITSAIARGKAPTGVSLAHHIYTASHTSDHIVLAASNAIRDADLCPTPPATIHANRGLAGIDGTIATALGVATATKATTRLLIGDVAFLHDVGSLAVPAPERGRANLQIVLHNDGGGGIFSLLEYGSDNEAARLERLFTTPHGTDVAAACRAWGVPHRAVSVPDAAQELVDPPPGVSVVEVHSDSSELATAHASLADAVADAVQEL